MPFYQHSVYGPSEPSQRQHPSAVDATPVQRQPFRMPREVLSPAPSPIPITPAYHSYHDDEGINAEENEEGPAGVSDEDVVADEAVLDVAVSDGPAYRNSREENGEGQRERTTSGRQRGQRPSEKYMSLPRDVAVNGDTEAEPSGRPVRNIQRQGRRHEGLVSSQPRASPQKTKPPAVSPPHSPSRRKSQEHGEGGTGSGNDEDDRTSGRLRHPSRHHASPYNTRPRGPATSAKDSDSDRDEGNRCPLPPSSKPCNSLRSSSSADSSPQLRRGSASRRRPSAQAEYEDARIHKKQHHAASSHLHPKSAITSTPRRGREERSPRLQPRPPLYCDQCDYLLPVEMEDYLLETSTYESVPRPHCPACGCRLCPTLPQPTGRDGEPQRSGDAPHESRKCEEDGGDHSERPRRPRRAPQQAAASSQTPPCRSPVKDQEEANLYSDPGDGEDLRGSEVAEQQHSRSDLEPAPQHQQQRSCASYNVSKACPSPPYHVPVLIPKPPYLTLELMPRSLASSLKDQRCPQQQGRSASDEGEDAGFRNGVRLCRHSLDLDDAGVPWATPGCTACRWQCGAAMAGVCCCCVMPCVLFRERQHLLLHQIKSRYVCCAGAFPCCVPPVSLRPELYYTVSTEYFDPSPRARRCRAAPPRDSQRPLYWGNAMEVSRESASESSEENFRCVREGSCSASQGAVRVAAFRSTTGIASPASLVNPRTGLPLEGCYRNMEAGCSKKHASDGGAGLTGGTSCCSCITFVDSTCVLNCDCRCCLNCIHPTAHCLACPLCCLLCELTFCVPCALWANRLLIRQHYNLGPDPAIDDGAACCYACCLGCCTCHTASVASQRRLLLQPQQTRHNRLAAKSAEPSPSLSCWSELATSVAACLAAVCCLCPCAACSLAQQRDQMRRLGFPLVVKVPPEMEMA
ncbi:hypothetical protein ABL78_4906 [Leptomonas seymouri]|uniref:Uncharacterized protein n=1 Tax=Leptomonas seymouri TaxID=5684 RepID=A0A0N0P5I7_LEPSE|nr:hypothetical protein ABL78_4906 [Leptomonas seymouri]|eukprot:KPI86037.1 hypothetical protein ABL78_4906 [Leptomonas seymouri]